MMPQPSGNRSQFVGDDRTRLLTPVGYDRDATQILSRFPESPAGFEPWPISPVHDELLLAMRDVAARDGGRQLVGEAFDLAEQRQAARFAATLPKAIENDPWSDGCPWLIAVGLGLATFVFALGFGLGLWVG